MPKTPRCDDNAQGSSDEEDSDSSGSNSDVSSQDDSLDVSDLDKFEDFGALTAGVDPRTLERDCSGHQNEVLTLPSQCSQILAADKVDCSTKCSQQTPGKAICENHARKMRTFFTRRLEPKTKSRNAFKWSLRPKRK